MGIPSVENAKNLYGKRVFVRVDFNVPLKDGLILNDFRIKAAMQTISFLVRSGAKVILATHLGGKNGSNLEQVSLHLKNLLPHAYIPVTDFVVISDHISKMENGQVVMLPNLRFWAGEERGDERFAAELSKLADIFVNEAFAVSHRNHASIILLPKLLPSYAGIRFLKEIENLSLAFNPEEPFLFILGGAKFQTKEPLISKFLNKSADVFVGGALANDFFAELGYETGRSLLSPPPRDISEEILKNKKLLLPVDVTVQDLGKNSCIKKPGEVKAEEKIVDVGPETVSLLKDKAEKAKLVIWNGPLGLYEEGFTKETEELAIAVAESVAFSIVGGGDTAASIARLDLESAFDFFSTGGGAMLEFLVKETLPGIDVLKL